MSSQTTRKITPWSFLFPFGMLFIVFLLVPLAYAIYVSLFQRRLGTLYFVGLNNYIQALQDTDFWASLVRVFFYAVVMVVLMVFVSLVLALLVESKYAKGKSFFRLVYFLPYAVPGVFAAVLWGYLYSQQLDPILRTAHWNPLSTGSLLYAIVNIVIWEWAGYNMTIYATSLAGISQELYEAARLDGCNEWQLARFIQIPLLRPTISMTAVLSMIGGLQLFNEPFLLMSLTPIPQNFTPNLDIYNTAFTMINLPYAATLSVVLAVITIGGACIVMVVQRLLSVKTKAVQVKRGDVTIGGYSQRVRS